jgi:hypothetical protein
MPTISESYAWFAPNSQQGGVRILSPVAWLIPLLRIKEDSAVQSRRKDVTCLLSAGLRCASFCLLSLISCVLFVTATTSA